jgi:DNA-binding NarL/FixJ family response regulator
MEDKYLNVLLIEDNVYDVRFLRRSLLREPLVELEQVDNIAGAIKRLEKGGIDIILLDLSLQDSQGVETFDRLYQHVSSLPIVVLTGYNDEDLAMKTLRHGAQDYLVKGMVDSASLIRAIRYAIERKHAEMQHKTSEQQLNALTANLEEIRKHEDRVRHFDHFVLPLLVSLEERLSSLNQKLLVLRPEDSSGSDQLDGVTGDLGLALESLRKFLKI